MGGNLFSTRRIDRETYYQTVAAIGAEVVAGYLPMGKIALVPSCSDKADYGDIDFIVESDAGTVLSSLESRLSDALMSGTKFNVNDGCVSVPWPLANDEFIQVDFICRPNNFEGALQYRSYSPLGHIAGAIFDENGYSFGEKGLFRKVTGHGGTKQFHVCNVEQGYALLDIDIKLFQDELNPLTEEELFYHLSGNKYLRWARFRRKDDKEMNSMARFADYLNTAAFLGRTSPLEMLPLDKVTDAHGHDWLIAASLHGAKVALLKDFRQHVNGESVSKATGLKGPELGAAMKRINETVEPLIEEASEKELDPIALMALALAGLKYNK